MLFQIKLQTIQNYDDVYAQKVLKKMQHRQFGTNKITFSIQNLGLKLIFFIGILYKYIPYLP